MSKSQDIRRLNKILKGKKDLSLGVKNNLQATIRLIKSENRKFKKLQKRGAGLGETSDKERIRWEDLETAFKSRIRTGLVINLIHKDLNSFFDDARK